MQSLTAAFLLVVAGAVIAAASPQTDGPAVTVFKSPTCGCCSKWIEHMRAAGFTVQVEERGDADVQKIKKRLGVPESAKSCHTAQIGPYVVEGHTPAADVKRLLEQRPAVVGLAVPGMPAGAPGMDVPGVRPRPYTVLSFDAAGKTQVFSTHKP